MNPAPLIEMACAYWHSATLIAAVRLDLFSRLAEGPANPAELAERLKTDPVATDALLTGLASLGLVTKTDDRFANAPLADTFLVAGRPAFLGPALQYNGDVYPLWADLHTVVRVGDATRAPDQYLGDDADRTRNFVYGMHHRALGVGRAVAQVIRLEAAPASPTSAAARAPTRRSWPRPARISPPRSWICPGSWPSPARSWPAWGWPTG
ncbi:MAG: methyltransferase dimerization domain-containing protein [bacterium]